MLLLLLIITLFLETLLATFLHENIILFELKFSKVYKIHIDV